MVIFAFANHHANNIPIGAPEHGNHYGTLRMHRTWQTVELQALQYIYIFTPPCAQHCGGADPVPALRQKLRAHEGRSASRRSPDELGSTS